LPAKGHVTVTIDEAFSAPLKARAEKNGRSVSGEVEYILKEAGVKPAKKEVSAQ
jgi:hypothetical protein